MQLLPTRVSVEQLDPGPGPLRRGQHFGACQRATAFMSVSSDVKLMFKGILAAETDKKSQRSGHEARPRCRREGRWRQQQQQQQQRLRVQATALAPARIRGERLLFFTSLI